MHFCNPQGPYNTAMSLECVANFVFCRKSTPAHRDKHAHIRDRGGDADLLSPIASVFYNDGLFHAEHQLSGGRGLPTNQLFPGKQVGVGTRKRMRCGHLLPRPVVIPACFLNGQILLPLPALTSIGGWGGGSRSG